MSPVQKTGILMLNMGGPQSLAEVEPFLRRLFLDRDIIKLPFQHVLGPIIAGRRSGPVRDKYAEIGGKSPIFEWTKKQGDMMCKLLDQRFGVHSSHFAYPAFRYADPLTEDAIDTMLRDGIRRVVAFSQYPHYSCTTSGSSFTAVAEHFGQSGLSESLEFRFIDRWCTHPKLISVFANNIRQILADNFESGKERDSVVILFTAHSIPRYVMDRGDTYPSEIGSTVELVMRELGYANPYRLVWQSKVGPLPWLSPSTEDAIEALVKRGQRKIVLVPIAFVNEHIETLHELDIEYAHELGQKVGAERILRCPTPNDSTIFIEALADIVEDCIRSEPKVSPQLLMRCIHCSNPRCGSTKAWIRRVSQQAVGLQ